MADKKIEILVVGATGNLGRLVVEECLKKSNIVVNVLVRNPNSNPELCQAVQDSGGKCLRADVTNPESLRDCTKGIHTVISTLMGDNETMINGQKNLLDDALKNGVERFVPSEFSVDLSRMELGEHYLFDQRLRFREILNNSPIKALYVTNGVFLEYYMHINKHKFSYWGDIDQKLDLTCQRDVARYLAAAVAKPERVGELKITGNELSTDEIVEIFNIVTENHFQAVREGSIEDIRNYIVELKNQKKILEVIQLGYLLLMYDGRGKILENNNSEFPEIVPTSFEDFLMELNEKNSYAYTWHKAVDKIQYSIDAY